MQLAVNHWLTRTPPLLQSSLEMINKSYTASLLIFTSASTVLVSTKRPSVSFYDSIILSLLLPSKLQSVGVVV